MFQPTTNTQKVIYTLIYPALLGSMLFEIFPIELCFFYLFKVLLVMFFFLDYYHLYFILDPQCTEEEKSSLQYMFGDLGVSLCLFIALKYINRNPIVSVWAVFFVSICFLVYSSSLKYHLRNYIVLTLISFFSSAFLTYTLYYKDTDKDRFWYPLFLGIVFVYYFVQVVWQNKNKRKTENTESKQEATPKPQTPNKNSTPSSH